MSTYFTGVTFADQKVAPSDDAIIRRAILPDGILTGCEISYSGSTLTMGAGQLMVCGRQIRHPSAQNWAVVDATSGYARLVLTIDLTRTATKDAFDQVEDSIEYASAEDGFAALEQADINAAGIRYQIAACVVSLGTGGITGIVSQLDVSRAEGAGLNFSVVGGVAQPSGPKENMIWVNTPEKVTGWEFSPTEPEEFYEGMVWILTGNTSTVSFNALKKNGIRIYPLIARQYVAGAWVDVDAKIYQDGQWNDLWDGSLYTPGNEYANFTGGWVLSESYGTGYDKLCTMEKTNEGLKIDSAPNGSGFARCFNKIDLSERKTITVKLAGTLPSYARIAITPDLSIGQWEPVNLAFVQQITDTGTDAVADISGLSGEYYVGIGFANRYDNTSVATYIEKVKIA